MLAEQIHEICEQINTVQKECHDMEVQPLDEDNRDEMNLQNLDCIEVMMELQQLNTESQDAEQYYDDRHTECMESGDDTQAILARSYHIRLTTQTEQDQEEGGENALLSKMKSKERKKYLKNKAKDKISTKDAKVLMGGVNMSEGAEMIKKMSNKVSEKSKKIKKG